jgi:hypothetical protein
VEERHIERYVKMYVYDKVKKRRSRRSTAQERERALYNGTMEEINA